MTIADDIGTLDWTAPGPGSWSADGTHCPKPVTPHLAEAEHAGFYAGFSESMRRYGLALEGLRQMCVNGFLYGTIVPAPEDEFADRVAAAAAAFETKLWRDDLRRWDDEVKPATVARHRQLGSVDLDDLSDDDLLDHLRTCRDHHVAMVKQHHQFNGAAIVPLGDFLVRATQWTDLPPARLLALFRGASPVSSGDCPERRAAVEAIAADPAARAVLEDATADADAVIDTLRGIGGAVAAAVDEWLAVVGHRLLDGFDVCYPTALERPEGLVQQLRTAVLSPPAPIDVSDDVASVRAAVPAEHRAAFDEALGEALLTYRLRDERGVYSDITAAGLMRRAMLAVGRRLAARGVLPDPELAVEADSDELVAMMSGGGPGADELAARRQYRERWSVDDIPRLIGDEPSPPPPLEMLPPPMARSMGAFMTVIAHLFQNTEAEHGASVVRGIGGSNGVHRGRARVVRTIDDVADLEEGDVLVTITTSEAFNCALGLAAAVVTDEGGMLSHAAILAREFGIPAVVGTRDATGRIPDGAVIEVDGTTGEVRILS